MTIEKVSTKSETNHFLSLLKKEQGLIEAGLELIDQMQDAMSDNPSKDSKSFLERPTKVATKKLTADVPLDSKNKKELDNRCPAIVNFLRKPQTFRTFF